MKKLNKEEIKKVNAGLVEPHGAGKTTLKDINLQIQKGEILTLVGEAREKLGYVCPGEVVFTDASED